MSELGRIRVAVLGSNDVATALLTKLVRRPDPLHVEAMVSLEPSADVLSFAERLGVPVVTGGLAGFIATNGFSDIDLLFDATSDDAHLRHVARLTPRHTRIIDLTPSPVGRLIVPGVSPENALDSNNLHMISCAGQAAVPLVAAVAGVVPVTYAELVAARAQHPLASPSTAPFTTGTADALRRIGRARRATASALSVRPDGPTPQLRMIVDVSAPKRQEQEAIRRAIDDRIKYVATYIPGYRRLGPLEITPLLSRHRTAGIQPESTHQVSVSVTTNHGDRPISAYTENLGVMADAAVRTAELVGRRLQVARDQ